MLGCEQFEFLLKEKLYNLPWHIWPSQSQNKTQPQASQIQRLVPCRSIARPVCLIVLVAPVRIQSFRSIASDTFGGACCELRRSICNRLTFTIWGCWRIAKIHILNGSPWCVNISLFLTFCITWRPGQLTCFPFGHCATENTRAICAVASRQKRQRRDPVHRPPPKWTMSAEARCRIMITITFQI